MLINENEMILVDLESMNEVHKNEIIILNNLYKSIIEKDKDNITKNFDLFIEDVKHHFDSEEKLMKQYSFPAIMKHKMAHMQAVLEIRKVRTDWDKYEEPEVLQDYFKNSFKPWLIRHLKGMDTVTAKYIKEKKDND